MTDQSPAETLEQLRQLEQENGDLKTRLAIIRISEPISASDAEKSNSSPSKRTSDVSAIDSPTPASLQADLTHYKELFSKLRFSYVEQVTKEKFLRAIVGDPPLIVGHNENVDLEAQLAEVKAELKSRKEEVRIMIEDMEKMGRDLASPLPESIENLESTIAGLRAKQVATMGTSSSQNLPLPATLSLLAEREAELAALNRQLAAVQNALPRKTREAEAMERELSVLERRRSEATAQAREAQRMKQEGKSDGLEELGRWYRSAEETLKSLVGVEG
ncbi:kinetochore protein Sos7 [Aspergillus lentulus]|uniref:Kinetochore protein Sos7 n=1 Tax=Aspergillus lentulus TaxID=293939 RepID=A0AAN5YK92_ASPLE|nr:hypothetical protein CNMCM6069_000110 [Aspergillus lentulus]KAF4163965.1 hypothetical protein CNMCM6936_000066 [Aspergillus lentulus]KAF4175933.1 hypothetical protein CNMCM8060_006778 [Aspergillus lentulus]KAF4181030.1 hypothetical protein CNMCM7927_000837 [Aspergillus lentulus]KAF4190297.1 hypothetical protein CNMCM8694_003766 [Aspergillus lentulus]